MIKNKFIIPAIIAKSQNELEEKIKKVKDFVELIQLDFMDGHFVYNTSIDFDFKIPKTSCNFEAHLMIKNPSRWIKKNYMKVDTILFHIESIDNPKSIIDVVKDNNKKVGIVINPESSIDLITDYIDEIDEVLVMTVNPGFYGSPFLPEMIEKISKLRKIAPKLDVEVDGGIDDKTIDIANKAGANMFVSGSYILKSKDPQNSIKTLKDIIKR